MFGKSSKPAFAVIPTAATIVALSSRWRTVTKERQRGQLELISLCLQGVALLKGWDAPVAEAQSRCQTCGVLATRTLDERAWWLSGQIYAVVGKTEGAGGLSVASAVEVVKDWDEWRWADAAAREETDKHAAFLRHAVNGCLFRLDPMATPQDMAVGQARLHRALDDEEASAILAGSLPNLWKAALRLADELQRQLREPASESQ